MTTTNADNIPSMPPFTFTAIGLTNVQAIRAHGIAFATFAALYDDNRVWADVIALLDPITDKVDSVPL